MSDRKPCMMCNTNLRAVNYKKGGKTFYRTLCEPCMNIKRKSKIPRWITEGYKKKAKCEACGFVPKYHEQLAIYDHNDTFKTICLNCEAAAKIANKIEVKRGDLKPDY